MVWFLSNMYSIVGVPICELNQGKLSRSELSRLQIVQTAYRINLEAARHQILEHLVRVVLLANTLHEVHALDTVAPQRMLEIVGIGKVLETFGTLRCFSFICGLPNGINPSRSRSCHLIVIILIVPSRIEKQHCTFDQIWS